VGEIPRNFAKAKEYFHTVAHKLWPVDWDPNGKPAGRKRLNKEAFEHIRDPATVAAGFLGRMALRGEGGKPDYKRARLWLDRAAELVCLILKAALTGSQDVQRTSLPSRAKANRSTPSASYSEMGCWYNRTHKRHMGTSKQLLGRI
jgi:hypothetical protein